ncbi:MAG: ATP-binding cassette domain-containing protein [Fuerstiella sp.]|nr:ATP-binding cassette domain-containing protein [Fuerstiella sp.]MCP4853400.1 ATP-binding cassette domain-containing protein [Fuerstiella sp.]
MVMSALAIEVSDVRCVFGSQTVLSEVSLRVAAGETVAIVGESGCGKSVTMKVMMQLLRPTSGRLKWFGRDVETLSTVERQQQRLRLGYLFQGAALFDSLTIYENVAFGMRQTGEQDEQNIHNTVLERLDEVGLSSEIVMKRPSEISGGMQKRVGLARALALSPDVMFYDEPTTGLDPVNSRRIDELIHSVQQSRGVTGIIVTHDLRTVQRVADRIVMLYPRQKLPDGVQQIIFDGSLAQLAASSDERVREYIGDELETKTAQEAEVERRQTLLKSA